MKTYEHRMKSWVRAGTALSMATLVAACGGGDGGGGGGGGGASGTSSYAIGGTLSGLAPGASVTLLDNAGDALKATGDGTFTFGMPIAQGGSFSVTVGTQPTGQTCSVASGSGSGVNANVTSVRVACTTMPVLSLLAGRAASPGATDGTGPTASFNYPGGVATDSAGNVYVADTENSTIRKISPAGVVTTLAGAASVHGSADGTGATASFNYPIGVATDNSGDVYVADTYNHTIRKITPAGVVTTLAGTAGVSGAADGTGAAASFSFPAGVATDSAGNVYVADSGNSTIREISPVGVVTTLAGTAGVSGFADGTGAAARFNHPNSVATDSAGNVYVADPANNIIRKITPAGVVTTLAGTAGVSGSADGTGAAASLNYPNGVATDSGGNVYVADSGNLTLRKISPAGVVTTVVGQGAFGFAPGELPGVLNYPLSVAIQGSTLYSIVNNTIVEVTNVP